MMKWYKIAIAAALLLILLVPLGLYLFSNGSLEEVRTIRISHLIATAMQRGDDHPDVGKEREILFQNLLTKKDGYKDESLFNILSKKKKVSNVDVAMHSSSDKIDGAHDVITMSFVYDGKPVRIFIKVTNNKSLTRPLSVEVTGIERIEIDAGKKVIVNNQQEIAEFLFDIAMGEDIKHIDRLTKQNG